MEYKHTPVFVFVLLTLVIPYIVLLGINTICNLILDKNARLPIEDSIGDKETLTNHSEFAIETTEETYVDQHVDAITDMEVDVDATTDEDRSNGSDILQYEEDVLGPPDNDLPSSTLGIVKRSINDDDFNHYNDDDYNQDLPNLSYELSEESFQHHINLGKNRRRLAPTFASSATKKSSQSMKTQRKPKSKSKAKKVPHQAEALSTTPDPGPDSVSNKYNIYEKDKRKDKIKHKPTPYKKAKDEKDKVEAKKMNAMLNPKPPLDLPIVKPEVQKLENEPAAKLIPTKGKPFHFHIPIVSKNPEKKLTLEELVEIAKKYKNPLTLNPVIFQAAASGQILTEKQLKSMKRMVRDSPVLDFLNLASVLGEDSSTSNARQLRDELDVMGFKRSSVLHLTATDELLQELVGDTDDLKNLGASASSVSTSTITSEKGNDNKPNKVGSTRTGNSLRKKRFLNQNDYDIKDQDAVPHRPKRGIKSLLRDVFSTKKTTTPKPTTLKSPHQDQDKEHVHNKNSISSSEEESKLKSPKHNRTKRGLGKWIKKVFGFGKTTTVPTTTTTTTTTTTPKPSSSSSSSSESGEKKHNKKSKKLPKKAKNSNKSPHKNTPVMFYINGDSEVDFLLPVDLRRSTWLRKHAGDKVEEEEDRNTKQETAKEPTKKFGK